MRRLKNITGQKSLLFFVLCLLVLPLSASAQIILTDSTTSLSTTIYPDFSVLIPGKEISFEQARASSNQFVPLDLKKGIPNFGVKKHSIWLKFKIQNSSAKTRGFSLSIANPMLQEVYLYTITGEKGEIDSILNGNKFPFNKRILHTSGFIFPIILPHNTDATIYLKIRSDLPLSLPISINNPRAQFRISAFKNAVMLAFIAILLVMVFYNSFVALSTKDGSYWYYILYLILLGLSQMSIHGFGYMYLWYNSPRFNQHSVILFSSLCAMSIIFFAVIFLGVQRKRDKYIYAIFCLLFLALCVSIVLDLFSNRIMAFTIMQITTLVGGIALIIISIFMLRYNKNARFFIYAWSILIIFNTIFILKDYGTVPTNKFTNNCVLIGSILEIIILSLGLANRINVLREERELQRVKALKLAHENELILSNQNAMLEEQVHKRTAELETNNEILNNTLLQLKNTQSQLVSAEKMSSLGQLTAGIAHEINNPINFVSANVSPLKRDGQILFDVIDKIEAIGTDSKISAVQRLREMAKVKEQADLDFLKEEIKLLIHGIQDGAARTAKIVRGLKIFSRVDEDTLKRSDINDGIRSTLLIANNMLKGIDITLQLSATLPQIYCYPGKMNQVFLNLISNAAFAIRQKFGQDKGGEIVIKSIENEDYITLYFKDDGVGMDEKTKEKLFEPFFTTKPVGEGTGLGMSIAFSILKEHGANCEVHSTFGQGTTFTLHIPINPIKNKDEINEVTI